MRRISLIIFLVMCGLCVAHALFYFPQLPEKVASHFDSSGKPNGWTTKTSFVNFYLVITGFVSILFLSISFGMPKIPESLINMPNKDYWLSGELKQTTFDFMFHYILWYASATNLFLLDTFHQSFQVSLGKADALTHPLLSLGLYIGFAAVWCIGFYMKFGKKAISRHKHAAGAD